MNKEVNNEYYSRELLVKSKSSVLSLWNSNDKCFIRNSNSINGIYPTATLHAFSSLLETCTTFNEDNTPINIDNILNFFQYTKENWIDDLLGHSSNVKKKDGINEKIYKIRALTVIERLLSVLDSIFYLVEDKKIIKESTERFKEIIDNYFETFQDELYPEPGVSPLPILKIVLIVKHYNSILKKTGKQEEYSDENGKLKKVSMSHINYHMARFNGVYEPSFDPISLTISLYANTILSPELKYTPFFNSCLQVITQNQNNNGCWSSGVSISFSDNGDVVQLPSVEIALFLTEIVNDKNILINYNENIKETLSIVLPVFRKFAKYLDITHNSVTKNNNEFKGWASDRIGRKDYVETWITAQANRFLYKLNITEKALLRNLSLEKLGVLEFQSKSLTKDKSIKQWDNNIIDPDDIVKPTDKIKDKYINPILQQKDKNSYIYYPAKDAVSFILFGPPGSGKTYLIEQMAKTLDLPLVEINPGHFIKNGLELIESTTKEIFNLLSNLNNAIVFFDECDELFRSREEKGNKSPSRTILSFATASMLPKLQKLHDNGQIIFILGTNYLQNIDKAIKRPGRFDDIFLLDRPCIKSREIFIRKNFKYKYNDRKIEDLAKATKFYAIKEIIAKCENNEDSITVEYQEWCKNTGKNELDNSRYNDEEIMKIKLRWEVK